MSTMDKARCSSEQMYLGLMLARDEFGKAKGLLLYTGKSRLGGKSKSFNSLFSLLDAGPKVLDGLRVIGLDGVL